MDLSNENAMFKNIDIDADGNQRVTIFVKNPSEELLLAMIDEDASFIHKMKNPSDKLKLAAAKKNSEIEKLILIKCDPNYDINGKPIGSKIIGMYTASECKRIAKNFFDYEIFRIGEEIDMTDDEIRELYDRHMSESDNCIVYTPEDAGGGQAITFQWFKTEEFKF